MGKMSPHIQATWIVILMQNLCVASKMSILFRIFAFLGFIKGAVSRNSAKLGNYKMPVKLRETKITA